MTIISHGRRDDTTYRFGSNPTTIINDSLEVKNEDIERDTLNTRFLLAENNRLLLLILRQLERITDEPSE